jgi:hypothetical protein
MPTTFNTTDPKPGYVYDSATDTWFPLLGIAPGSSVVRWRFTAVGGETSVSGLDDLGATLSYNAGTEQVYLNGVLLVRTEDYLATTGTSITGLTALAASDVIEVISFNATNVQITDALLETDINAKGDLIVGAAVDTAAILTSGTNGQVLSVNTATATGLEWVTSDDANAIQNAIVDAKGDIVTATADNTPARLGVGSDGQLLTADSSSATGLSYQNNFAAGKNKIINGDFSIWQRGTSFTPSVDAFTADRYKVGFNGTGATRTISQQTFTPGTAPVAGYEGSYFIRCNQSVAGTGGTYNSIGQPIEDVRTFSGQTITFSFWAKANSNISVSGGFNQIFGSGGSSAFFSTDVFNINLTTSWERFTYTVTLPSVSGKTIGSNSRLDIFIQFPSNTTFIIDTWGWQVEAGSVATAFQTATGTIQGELAACQRYYFRATGQKTSFYTMTNMGFARNTTVAYIPFQVPVTMRAMSSLEYANIRAVRASTDVAYTTGTFTFTTNNTLNIAELAYTHGTGIFTQGENVYLGNNNSASAYIAISGEL